MEALAFLSRRIPAAPASYLRQLLRMGRIGTADGPLREGELLVAGRLLRLPESNRLRELLVKPVVQILYESREILIVAKPAGLAVHAGYGHETEHLVGCCQALLKERGERFSIAPVHRLDLETTGPVIFAKGRAASAALGKLFMADAVEKSYLALVSGNIAASAELCTPVPAKGKFKEARCTLRPLIAGSGATLIEVRLQSGRQHQIRRQLTDCGHSLYGDRRYGGPTPAELPRLFLHCHRIAFLNPFSDTPVVINLPLPKDLATFLEVIGMPLPPS